MRTLFTWFCTISSLVLVSVGKPVCFPILKNSLLVLICLLCGVFFNCIMSSRVHLLRWLFGVLDFPKISVCANCSAGAQPLLCSSGGGQVAGCLGGIAVSCKCTKCKPSQGGDYRGRANHHSYLLCRRLGTCVRIWHLSLYTPRMNLLFLILSVKWCWVCAPWMFILDDLQCSWKSVCCCADLDMDANLDAWIIV